MVNTKRTDAPLPHASDSEHATYSEVFYTEATGTVLLRVIHEGQILELISLSTDAPPIRFIFPASILPNPALVWNDAQELHILAMTSIGSLFRIIVPTSEGTPLWQAATLPYIAIREYVVSKAKSDPSRIFAHVHGLYSVALALHDGSLLRLEVEQLGQDGEDGM